MSTNDSVALGSKDCPPSIIFKPNLRISVTWTLNIQSGLVFIMSGAVFATLVSGRDIFVDQRRLAIQLPRLGLVAVSGTALEPKCLSKTVTILFCSSAPIEQDELTIGRRAVESFCSSWTAAQANRRACKTNSC
jgi:hypothetical protein